MKNVSFFIPAYNCASNIEEAVESIITTNFFEGDELVITNDCSTDNTTTVLKALQAKYPVITVINHKRNKGGAAARNTSIENTKHELLFCLDSDNVLNPKTITPLKEYLINSNADIAAFEHQHFFNIDKHKPVYIWSIPPGEVSLDTYLKRDNTPGQHGNYLFTRTSWLNAKGYAEGCGALDTWTFGLRQAITGAKSVILKDTLYYHRISDDSYWMRDNEAFIWANSVKAAIALFPFFDIIEEKFLAYMLGEGKYKWFYTLQSRPLKLVKKGAKQQFYAQLQAKIHDIAYPKPFFFTRIFNKLKREIGIIK